MRTNHSLMVTLLNTLSCLCSLDKEMNLDPTHGFIKLLEEAGLTEKLDSLCQDPNAQISELSV